MTAGRLRTGAWGQSLAERRGREGGATQARRRRYAAPPSLLFTKFSQAHYSTSEGGALLMSERRPTWRAAVCFGQVMNTGLSCAEFTVVRIADRGCGMQIGVARPTLGTNKENVDEDEVMALVHRRKLSGWVSGPRPPPARE